MDGDIEYIGLVAETWDALRGDTSSWSDRAFYLELIRERGEPALDVGCGTGRLILEFMSLGIDIDGVDNSPEMLAICRRKARRLGLQPNVHLQRMESLSLPRRYRTIMVPSSSFQLIIDPSAAERALRRFHDHLVPGGTLAMPFGGEPSEPSDETSVAEAPMEDGSFVRKTLRAVYDPVSQVESTDELYEVFREGAIVCSERHVRERATRGYTTQQVAAILERTGYADVEWYSGFTREPARPGDLLYTVVARRSVDAESIQTRR